MQFDGVLEMTKNDPSWPNFGDLLTPKHTYKNTKWIIIVSVLHICKKANSGMLSEVGNTSHLTIGDNLEIYGGHFEFCLLKNFARGGLSGTFDMLFPTIFRIIWAIFQLCSNFAPVKPYIYRTIRLLSFM